MRRPSFFTAAILLLPIFASAQETPDIRALKLKDWSPK